MKNSPVCRMVCSRLTRPLLLTPAGDHQDSPSSLMLETPSLGGARRIVSHGSSQNPPCSNSLPTSHWERSLRNDSSTESIVALRTSGLSIYSAGPREPLRDLKAARLLQHFIYNLASWVRSSNFAIPLTELLLTAYSLISTTHKATLQPSSLILRLNALSCCTQFLPFPLVTWVA